MNILKDKYWLYLEPDVFIFLAEDKVVLYNSLSKKIVNLQLVPENKRLINKLLDPENLYVIPLTKTELNNKFINQFVNIVRDSYLGDLIPQSEGVDKPALIPPNLKIHRNKTNLKKDGELTLGEDILSMLKEVTFYLNGKCMQTCKECGEFNRQFDFCHKSIYELDITKVKVWLDKLRHFCNKINLNGGNIFEYAHFSELMEFILLYQIKVDIYCHYLNFEPSVFQFLDNKDIMLCLYITYPVNIGWFNENFKRLSEVSERIKYVFIIKSEEDIVSTQEIIEKNNIVNYEVKPFYNKENRAFFEENVYLNKENICEELPDKRDVFIRQTFNIYDFGRLRVTSGGEVFSNANYPFIGTIQDKISDVVIKEFEDGNAWFRIRDMKPCCNCVYQWLCPSPSNYELVIGKPNLCYIKE
ncbi:TIGR04150 pseudo-rSAM protein [Parabacteroides pacaensis]|uniref:TIGR04150 pseudo-rSAM protein n=1 Tax=Parabacteroides pacaensis TaxID=2086575 RepID=UPI000D110573|nr:TIGR04150 pseudo-rSAM protein [Parabacteroides pacaensis]